MATASSRNCAHEFEANYPVECHRLARLNKHPAAIELELEWDIVEMHWMGHCRNALGKQTPSSAVCKICSWTRSFGPGAPRIECNFTRSSDVRLVLDSSGRCRYPC